MRRLQRWGGGRGRRVSAPRTFPCRAELTSSYVPLRPPSPSRLPDSLLTRRGSWSSSETPRTRRRESSPRSESVQRPFLPPSLWPPPLASASAYGGISARAHRADLPRLSSLLSPLSRSHLTHSIDTLARAAPTPAQISTSPSRPHHPNRPHVTTLTLHTHTHAITPHPPSTSSVPPCPQLGTLLRSKRKLEELTNVIQESRRAGH